MFCISPCSYFSLALPPDRISPRVHDLFFYFLCVCVRAVSRLRSFWMHFSAILVWCLEGKREKHLERGMDWNFMGWKVQDIRYLLFLSCSPCYYRSHGEFMVLFLIDGCICSKSSKQ